MDDKGRQRMEDFVRDLFSRTKDFKGSHQQLVRSAFCQHSTSKQKQESLAYTTVLLCLNLVVSIALFIREPIPYVGQIPAGLQFGTTITIQGKIAPKQPVFSVNLTTGPSIDPLPDVALHLSFRFADKAIVRNCLKNDTWGTEERDGGFPLENDQLFELIILVCQHGFMVAINGRHFTTYTHKMDKKLAKFLLIKDDIHIHFIRIDGSTIVPPVSPQYKFPPIYSPSVPLITKILGGIHPQKMIVISGVPKSYNPRRFTVNLRAGNDIAFHFDVRFDHNGYINRVFRNSLQLGIWDKEEDIQPYFPFQPAVGFDILILVESFCYKVAVNSQHFITFSHRLKEFQSINILEITGDVNIKMVQFH